jgi:hypothetical protein
MKDYLQIIIGLSSLFVIIFVIVICFVLNNKYKKFVLANSDKIKELELLNKQTIFHESIKSEYYFKE